MKIAIDLNDVIRKFTYNYAEVYIRNYNRDFDMDSIEEVWTNDLKLVFPFKTDEAYVRFVYEDYAYDIFGKCELMERERRTSEGIAQGTATALNEWLGKTIRDIDCDEEIEVMFVSPMEMGASIGATYFFLSKLNLPVREVYFPKDSLTIWDKCDVLITANPDLLKAKPDGKKSIKIKADYNKDCEADMEFQRLTTFLCDENNTIKLLNHE